MKHLKNFAKYFVVLLALTIIYDLSFGTYEAAQQFLTGKIFGTMFIFFGSVFAITFFVVLISHFIGKVFGFNLCTTRQYFSNLCNCDLCKEEIVKKTKRRKTTSVRKRR